MTIKKIKDEMDKEFDKSYDDAIMIHRVQKEAEGPHIVLPIPLDDLPMHFDEFSSRVLTIIEGFPEMEGLELSTRPPH